MWNTAVLPPSVFIPGITRGLSVKRGSGLALSIERGSAVSSSGTLLRVEKDLDDYLSIPSTESHNRWDFVYIQSSGGISDVRYFVGNSENNHTLSGTAASPGDAILLAKVLVVHPLTSLENVYIFNSTQVRGEYIMRGITPVTPPDGVRKSFIFPVPFSDDFSIDLDICGIRQVQGVDFSAEIVQNDNGQDAGTKITISDAPPSSVRMRADIYLGKAKYTL